jgi:catechol 2,3-dioxygenase-like lactoylglutathione lyase family enzyme
MTIVPIIKVRDMRSAIKFYTRVLDFRLKFPIEAEDGSPVVDLVRDGGEIQLSTMSGDGVFGTAVNISVNEVDDLFTKFVSRGLNTSGKLESPVHQGPLDQSWGMREFYVTDPDGNTLRFRTPVRRA